MFNLLPSSPQMEWLIYADWLEERGESVKAAAIRSGLTDDVIFEKSGDGYGYGYGDGDGDGDGDVADGSYGGDGGDGYGNGYGGGYGGCYGYGDGSGGSSSGAGS